MTKEQVKEVLDRVLTWPEADQEKVARFARQVEEWRAGDEITGVIDPAHLADVLEGLAQAKGHQFATDAEIEAAFRRFDR